MLEIYALNLKACFFFLFVLSDSFLSTKLLKLLALIGPMSTGS